MYAPTAPASATSRPEFGRIAIGEIEPAAYRKILQGWCAQRGARAFPRRQQIDPFLVPALAANILLFEVRDGNVFYRVLGEKVVMALKADIRGKSPREAFGDTPDIRMIEHQLLYCAETGTPLYSRHDFRLEDAGYAGSGHSRKAWRIALPYGDQGVVTRLLCYQLFSEAIEIDLRPETDFDQLLPQTVFRIDV